MTHTVFESTDLEDGLVIFICPLGRSPKTCWLYPTIPYDYGLQIKALAVIQHSRVMLLPGGAQSMSKPLDAELLTAKGW